ncbi:MAG: hypothetical protein H6806_06690 [Planctomycetes bacterium]|nr:hypothetical protein [Planctomycetota bacterium]
MAAHDQAGASAGDPTPPTGDSSGGSGERILDLDIASELKQSPTCGTR